jgi:large subunit ribosomal protein L25
MATIKLGVQARNEIGNGPNRRLRDAGYLPGVVYGKGSAATPISIANEEFRAVLAHGYNVVLELGLDAQVRAARKGDGRAGSLYAVIKELQFHPIKRTLLHVDLQEVDLDVEIEAPVAIELVGTPAGVADGGVLDWGIREVTVRALPIDIPAAIELDVSEMLIGHRLTVAALSAGQDVTIIDDPEIVIAVLQPPRIQEEEEVAADEVMDEPEVVGDKSDEE